MVMRTFRVGRISFIVEKDRINNVLSALQNLKTDKIEITKKGNEISIEGDLHEYKLRNKLIYILSGGKLGENL